MAAARISEALFGSDPKRISAEGHLRGDGSAIKVLTVGAISVANAGVKTRISRFFNELPRKGNF